MRLGTSAVMAAALLLCGQSAQAAAKTWAGSAGSTDWLTGTNWGGSAPVTGDSLTFTSANASASATLTNTLTSSAFNIAGITFNAGSPAYTMTGNTFNLTAGITNSSSNIQTFNNTGGISVSAASTFAVTSTGGITIADGSNGLINSANNNLTLTVNGAGGLLTLGGLALSNNSSGRTVALSGSGDVSIGAIVNGGSATTGNFTYQGTGTATLTGANTYAGSTIVGNTGLPVTASKLVLSGSLGATPITVYGGATFTETGTGVIGGGSSTTLTIGGTTTLAGSNTYTGLTTVNSGGVLNLDFSASGAPASNIINSGNALVLGSNPTMATSVLNPTGVTNYGASTASSLAVGGLSTLNITGKSTGTTSQTLGNLTLNNNTANRIVLNPNGGSGTTLTLGNTWTRGAGSTLNIDLSAAGTSAVTSTPTLASSGVLGFATVTDSVGTGLASLSGGNIVRLTGQTILTSSSNSVGTNFISSPVSSSSTGSPYLTLAGNTVINSLTLDSSGASGANFLDLGTGTLTVASGAILSTGANAQTIQNGQVGASGQELIVHTLGAGALTINGTIGGDATSLTKSGSGSLTLGGTNTYTGATVINGGTLKAGSASAFGSNSAVIIANVAGAGLDLNGNDATIGSLTGGGTTGGTLALGSNTLTVGTDNTSPAVYAGQITGTGGSIVKVGNGVLQLGNNLNSFTGGVTIKSGTLGAGNAASGNGAFGSGTITLGDSTVGNSNNATLATTAGSATQTNAINVVAGTSGLLQIYNQSGNNTWSGAITLNNNLTLTNPGGGSNGYTGGITGTASGVVLTINATSTGNTTLSGGTGTNFNGSIVAAGTGTSATAVSISNVIGTSVTGVTQASAGTLNLNANNLYTGTTTVNSGILNLGFNNASAATNVIASGNALVMGGGTLGATGKASTTNSQTFGSTTLNAGGSAFTITNNATSNPVLINLGAITRNTGSTVNFTQPTVGSVGATNGYTTSTTNDAGGILGGYATVGGTDWATNNGTNIAALGSYFTNVTTSASYDATKNVNVTTSTVLDGAILANTLRFNTAAANTLTLTGTNTLTDGGILVTSTVGANTSTITGGTLQGAAGKDLVIIQNNASGALAISSIIADNTTATGLTKSGAGTLTLTGANTYTGATNVNAGTLNVNTAMTGSTSYTIVGGGTLAVGVANALPSGSAISLGSSTLGTSGTLALGSNNLSVNSVSLKNGSISGTGILTSATAFDVQNGTITANLAGSNGLIKTTGGTVTLGANSYTGTTIIKAGTLVGANGSSSFGTGNIILGDAVVGQNAALTLSANVNHTNNISVASGSGTRTLIYTGGTVTLSGAITLANDLTLLSTSTNSGGVIFTGGMTGTGNLVLMNTTGATAPFTFNTGTLNFTGIINNVGPTATITSFNNIIGTSVTGLVQNSAGTMVLNAANTFAGDTTLTQGTLNLRNSSALQNSVLNVGSGTAVTFGTSTTVGLSSASVGGLTGSGNVTLNDTLTSPGSVALSIGNSNGAGTNRTLNPVYVGSLSGTGSLTKIGTNTQILAGANTYSGTTTVNAGTLLINGSITSAVTVNNSGSVFGGSGSSNAALSLTSGTTLAPGSNGIGTFTTTGATSLTSATFAVEFNSTLGTFDQLVTNGLTLTTSTLSLTDLGGATLTNGSSFTIVDNTNGITSISGTFVGLSEGSTITVGSNTFIISYAGGTGNDITLTVSAVPEPATYAAIFGALALVGTYWRRRRSVVKAN
jgi:autotransporter-associated beta strand protein